MRSSIVLSSAFFASAYAAPSYPSLNLDAAMPGSIQVVSEYFSMLARKIQEQKYMSGAPFCDLSKAQLPSSDSKTPLPPPTAGYALKHIAVGRGTQNYTCDTTKPEVAPVAAGAVATLFNASCVGASYPKLLDQLSRVAILFNLTEEERMGPTNMAISGKHYFAPNLTVPFFDLDLYTGEGQVPLGRVGTAKDASGPAPAGAPRGQLGEPAVAWLKLKARPGLSTGDLREVYRVGTVGGSPPSSCVGMPATFSVQYSAQYWFYEGKESP